MKKKKGILVFNAGSSSIKYSFFENLELKESGNFERLKTERDYKKAVEEVLEKISSGRVDAIAHRVVHGGNLRMPSRITKKIKSQIRKFSEFAPLHNPKELMVISTCEKYHKPQYAVFDTMFFSNLPENAKNYPLPKKLAQELEIKRLGFHGLSHEFVSKGLKGKTITCHLGAGSSISAIINEKPIDTSMGFTPLEGVMMCTRSGSIDPGIILFLGKKNLNVGKILEEESGIKGISGFSDFRDVRKNMQNKDCRLAYSMFVNSIIKTIGSFIPVLNGLDNLVFTGAIGDNVGGLRERVCNHFRFLGIDIDDNKNKSNSRIISSKRSKIKVFVIKTDEEIIIAEKILKLL